MQKMNLQVKLCLVIIKGNLVIKYKKEEILAHISQAIAMYVLKLLKAIKEKIKCQLTLSFHFFSPLSRCFHFLLVRSK